MHFLFLKLSLNILVFITIEKRLFLYFILGVKINDKKYYNTLVGNQMFWNLFKKNIQIDMVFSFS